MTDNCIICLEKENITNKCFIFGCDCKIMFHEICFSEYIEIQEKCPFCRKNIISNFDLFFIELFINLF